MDYSPHIDRFMTYGAAAMQKVAAGEMTPEEALAEAVELINAEI